MAESQPRDVQTYLECVEFLKGVKCGVAVDHAKMFRVVPDGLPVEDFVYETPDLGKLTIFVAGMLAGWEQKKVDVENSLADHNM